MNIHSPINFKKWIDEHRDVLKPPVGNKVVWEDGEFIIMVVGGPNSRKDYHYNQTPEFFYQIEGDIVVKIQDNGIPKDIHIKEGEIFLLPSCVPHSPQRGSNTIGLVVEYKRAENMQDALQWHCEKCNELLYKEFFLLQNIEVDLPKIFDKFYSNQDLCTCKNCATIMQAPVKLS